ncbi:hypothetical protein DFH06DRAFT_1132196 [Mycena polygramma]|nr:hypothetical protein DFH06DRAFT_1132196 [Mycena polygramma]
MTLILRKGIKSCIETRQIAQSAVDAASASYKKALDAFNVLNTDIAPVEVPVDDPPVDAPRVEATSVTPMDVEAPVEDARKKDAPVDGNVPVDAPVQVPEDVDASVEVPEDVDSSGNRKDMNKVPPVKPDTSDGVSVDRPVKEIDMDGTSPTSVDDFFMNKDEKENGYEDGRPVLFGAQTKPVVFSVDDDKIYDDKMDIDDPKADDPKFDDPKFDIPLSGFKPMEVDLKATSNPKTELKEPSLKVTVDKDETNVSTEGANRKLPFWANFDPRERIACISLTLPHMNLKTSQLIRANSPRGIQHETMNFGFGRRISLYNVSLNRFFRTNWNDTITVNVPSTVSTGISTLLAL